MFFKSGFQDLEYFDPYKTSRTWYSQDTETREYGSIFDYVDGDSHV